ncbi:hypothetical protein ACFT4A_38605 [Streptomyces sp. NPDC057099]|uniref:hypothetical protein n=1 Tax=Streptomyces sp. NPDC057099 TaxID=3346019 RepID=UPI003631FAB5
MGNKGSVAVVVAGLVLVVGGCGGGGAGDADGSTSSTGSTGRESASSTPVRPPSGELVKWAGGVCESTIALDELRAESAADLREIRGEDEGDLVAGATALGYLSTTPSAVDRVQGSLEDLGPSGVPAADRMLDALRKKVSGVAAKLEGVSPAVGLEDAGDTAADVDQQVQTLTPPKPDLPALAEKDPRLAAAYRKADQCAPGWKPGDTDSPDPTGPLPGAADGKNFAACSDGECEVLVTSTADITANGTKVHVTVADEHVTFRTDGAVMQLGGTGGEAGFGDSLKATIVAHNKDGAVLKFSTS